MARRGPLGTRAPEPRWCPLPPPGRRRPGARSTASPRGQPAPSIAGWIAGPRPARSTADGTCRGRRPVPPSPSHPAPGQLGEEPVGQVQSRGGAAAEAGRAGEHRLVALGVGQPLPMWRRSGISPALQRAEERDVAVRSTTSQDVADIGDRSRSGGRRRWRRRRRRGAACGPGGTAPPTSRRSLLEQEHLARPLRWPVRSAPEPAASRCR